MKTIQIEISDSPNAYLSIATAIDGLISETLSDLRKKGYTLSFRREAAGLYCVELDQWIMTKGFEIDHYVYIRSASHPDADRIVYAISLPHGAKGYLIDTCFVYADNISAEMEKKLEWPNVMDTSELSYSNT